MRGVRAGAPDAEQKGRDEGLGVGGRGSGRAGGLGGPAALSGSLNVRLFQGFSIRVSGNYSWIRDQLYLSGEGATNEQILLRQRQLETSFRYFTSFGIEYRFGSIFNNIVNPRFGGSNSEFFF